MAAPATVAARVAVDPRVRRLALWLVLLSLGIPMLIVISVLSVIAEQAASDPAAMGETAGIPPQYVPLYNMASQAFTVNPYLLAAIHKHETGFSTHPDTYRVNFAGCCIGAMQMNITDGPPSTWDSVKDAYRQGERPDDYPHPDEPHPRPTDDFDAIMAAAKLLRAKASGRKLPELDAYARDAARRYNGAGPVAEAYADRVMATARAFEAQAKAPNYGGSGKLAWPVPPSTPMVSPFGMRWGRLHAGVDLAIRAGAPIVASESGRITIAGWVSGYGNFICIQHSARLGTCYAHQSRFASGIRVGLPVKRGELIGYVGCTGHCFGDHLHYEVRLGAYPAVAVDPMPYLR